MLSIIPFAARAFINLCMGLTIFAGITGILWHIRS